jgi:hypothetical protein
MLLANHAARMAALQQVQQQQDEQHTQPCGGLLGDAAVKAAIRAHLGDPTFYAYLQQVERLWDEVQDELGLEAKT